MKKYFQQYLKKNLVFLLLATLFFMIMYVIPLTIKNYAAWNSSPPNLHEILVRSPDLHFEELTIALVLMSVLVPLVMFSYKMNKRSVDMYYSLPLSKRKIMLVHFFVGLIILFGSYTAAYLVGFIVAAIEIKWISLIYYLPFYLSTIIPVFAIYAATSFLFTRANTWFDGMVCLCGAYCIFALIVSMIKANFNLPGGCRVDAFFPFTVLSSLSETFRFAIKRGYISSSLNGVLTADGYGELTVLIGSALWALIGIASTVALIYSEPHSRAENCGQISESIFCYKVQIPVYAFLLSSIFDTMDILSIGIVIFAIYVVSALYKRSFKIGLKFTIVLLSSIALGTIFGCVANLI